MRLSRMMRLRDEGLFIREIYESGGTSFRRSTHFCTFAEFKPLNAWRGTGPIRRFPGAPVAPQAHSKLRLGPRCCLRCRISSAVKFCSVCSKSLKPGTLSRWPDGSLKQPETETRLTFVSALGQSCIFILFFKKSFLRFLLEGSKNSNKSDHLIN